MTLALIDFGRFEFSLNARQSDGQTLRQHLEAVEKMTGEIPAMLKDRPVLPAECRPTWAAFCALSNRRQSGINGPSPINWLEIDAYQRVTGDTLRPWQVDAITRLDSVWLEEATKK